MKSRELGDAMEQAASRTRMGGKRLNGDSGGEVLQRELSVGERVGGSVVIRSGTVEQSGRGNATSSAFPKRRIVRGEKTRVESSRPHVLLTEGSSSSSRQTIVSLGSSCIVDVLDPSPICQSRFSRHVRRVFRCPNIGTDPRGYLEYLVKRLQTGNYDVLFPTHEQAYLLAKYRDDLSQLVGLAVPPFESIRRVQDKGLFALLLDELELSGPKTVQLSSYHDLHEVESFPCYLKLPHSTAANGVFYIESREAMERMVASLLAEERLGETDELLIQEPVYGEECVAFSVFEHGVLKGVHATRSERAGIGSQQLVRVGVSHLNVVEDIRKIGAHLNWHGAIFFDYMYDDGKPYYIEGNPRIGETVNAKLSGLNLADLMVRISMGEQVEEMLQSNAGVRSQVGFMTLFTSAMEHQSRLAVLKTIWHELTGRRRDSDLPDETTQLYGDWPSIIPPLFISAKLLIQPSWARAIVDEAVDRYSVPASAAKIIDELPDDLVRRLIV